MNWLYIGIGGFVGANVRYLLATWLNQQQVLMIEATRAPLAWPWGTLFVNVIGSFLLALLGSLAGRALIPSESVRLMIGTGFFGAFTTFSTFANEAVQLDQVSFWHAAGYVLLTNGICLVGVMLGLWLGQRLAVSA